MKRPESTCPAGRLLAPLPYHGSQRCFRNRPSLARFWDVVEAHGCARCGERDRLALVPAGRFTWRAEDNLDSVLSVFGKALGRGGLYGLCYPCLFRQAVRPALPPAWFYRRVLHGHRLPASGRHRAARRLPVPPVCAGCGTREGLQFDRLYPDGAARWNCRVLLASYRLAAESGQLQMLCRPCHDRKSVPEREGLRTLQGLYNGMWLYVPTRRWHWLGGGPRRRRPASPADKTRANEILDTRLRVVRCSHPGKAYVVLGLPESWTLHFACADCAPALAAPPTGERATTLGAIIRRCARPRFADEFRAVLTAQTLCREKPSTRYRRASSWPPAGSGTGG